MKKDDVDKARKRAAAKVAAERVAQQKAKAKLVGKVRLGLLRGSKTVAQIAEETGYTTQRIYQIRKAMTDNGELTP